MRIRPRSNPHLYEINTRILVERMSRDPRRSRSLLSVPDEYWRNLARCGFDLVWLMGVWRRSPGARRIALLHPDLRRVYDEVLPGWTESDVDASPYAVLEYSLDPPLGAPTDLSAVRGTLNRHGLGLIVDFVPNHLALDHPWTFAHPQRFVVGNEAARRDRPDWYFSPDGKTFLAHGRDPNFPPWTDTAQVNFFSPDLRRALLREIVRIAEVADGVRCDMAMLALNHVFRQTWESQLSGFDTPAAEFWAELIESVKRRFPGFLFIGEAYWDLEPELLRLGFDFVYDKGFYDMLRSGTPMDVRDHLKRTIPDSARSLRFIENHDEPRAMTAFGRERLPAAAVILATVPGMRLFHDGQLEGRTGRLPVQLVRDPGEPSDPDTIAMYSRLLEITNAPAYHEGVWSVMEIEGADGGDESHRSLLAWAWRHTGILRLIVVNYSPRPARGYLKLPSRHGSDGELVVRDELTGRDFRQNAEQLPRTGLACRLGPWETRLLQLPDADASG